MAGRLSLIPLRHAVLSCIHDRRSRDDTAAALWREDPERVGAMYDATFRRLQDDLNCPIDGRHGLLAERMRELRKPLLSRAKLGLTITEMATKAGVDRETMARALEHHGYLELVPYGGPNRRRLVTRAAENAGLGHNPDGSRMHIGRLEGFAKACVFPVFYPEHFDTILWTLDLDGIRARAEAIANKRRRLAWLLDAHCYLPNGAIADLAGCSEVGARRARSRIAAKVSLQVIGPLEHLASTMKGATEVIPSS